MEMTNFHIVLYGHVKSYNCFFFYMCFNGFTWHKINLHNFTQHKIDLHNFTLAQNINKFHYDIYTYMECKSSTIYTDTRLV